MTNLISPTLLGGRKRRSPRRNRLRRSRMSKRRSRRRRSPRRSQRSQRSWRRRSPRRNRRSRSRMSKRRRRSKRRSKRRSRKKKWRPGSYRRSLKSSCFLDPKRRKYPVCNKNGKVTCQGIKAAKSRAAMVAGTRNAKKSLRLKARSVFKRAKSIEKRKRCK